MSKVYGCFYTVEDIVLCLFCHQCIPHFTIEDILYIVCLKRTKNLFPQVSALDRFCIFFVLFVINVHLSV